MKNLTTAAALLGLFVRYDADSKFKGEKTNMSETISKSALKQFISKEITLTKFYTNSEMQAVTITLETVLREVESGKFDVEESKVTK